MRICIARMALLRIRVNLSLSALRLTQGLVETAAYKTKLSSTHELRINQSNVRK